ncbi:MAG: hypothetical protein BWZ08_00128 [candidate division BRC1 bacterium ADurb.BinA292]|nr:MAG: hypothetical protein BWZ08_00128 [candidate division BRC1 bacterium ADurb.BinA292]
MKIALQVTLLLALWMHLGCARYEIGPLPNESQVVLDADQTVQVLLQVGLSDQVILKHGARVRETLARTGAVQIRNGRYTEAILAAHPPYIYMTCRDKGSMIYPLEPVSRAVEPELSDARQALPVEVP